MVNPYIKNRRLLIVYFAIWFFIFLAHITVLKWVLGIEFYDAIFDSAFFNGLYMFLGISLWYTVNFNSLENYTSPKIFVNHIAAAVITSSLWIGLGYYLLKNILIDDKVYQTFLLQSLVWRFLIGVLFYIVIVAVDYVIIYYNNFPLQT